MTQVKKTTVVEVKIKSVAKSPASQSEDQDDSSESGMSFGGSPDKLVQLWQDLLTIEDSQVSSTVNIEPIAEKSNSDLKS